MSINYKKIESGWFSFFIIFMLIALLQSNLGCGDYKETKQIDYDKAQIDTIKKKTSFPTCEDEKQYLITSLSVLSSRIDNLSKSYDKLINDETAWNDFITNWNQYASLLGDDSKNITLTCIQINHYQNIVSAFKEIGLFYSTGDIKKAKEFTRIFHDLINDLNKELETAKE